MKTATLSLRNSMNCAPLRLALLLIPLALACFALPPQARATCQDACLTNNNTVQGDDALLNNTGSSNTAIGFNALFSNTSGSDNTAVGDGALFSNFSGSSNTAIGSGALFDNISGFGSTAVGAFALHQNSFGTENTAIGGSALGSNTTGSTNTAMGLHALTFNTTGNNNTAIGTGALFLNTGNGNIALGNNAGSSLTTGSNNIDIGAVGSAGESKTIRIGKSGVQTKTFIQGISGATVPSGVQVIEGSGGQLGTVVSSERFKDAIKPMDKASEAVLALNPVTFRYKHDLDPEGILQFGLVAEQVEKVNRDLVARDEQGKPYAVRYEAVNAMLLNEFLKEHRKVEQMQKQIDALTAGLQKVSAQLELSKAAPRTVENNP
jgi:hypothetical protein